MKAWFGFGLGFEYGWLSKRKSGRKETVPEEEEEWLV
jgi:hypothetical protein